RACWLARKLKARRTTFDRQIGMAAVFSGPCDPVTLVEAAENGWGYSAPLPGGEQVGGYLTEAGMATPSHYDRLLSETRYIRERVHGSQYATCVRTFMADSYRVHLPEVVGVCLHAGAAALGLDPLSSDGISFALRSGCDAGRALAAHLAGDHGA